MNKCSDCKFFRFNTAPVMSWQERYDHVKKTGVSESWAKTLANDPTIFEQKKSELGKCGCKALPELRDIELNSTTFGCIYFKK